MNDTYDGMDFTHLT